MASSTCSSQWKWSGEEDMRPLYCQRAGHRQTLSGEHGVILPLDTETSKGSEVLDEELLPGILNDITFCKIIPKLSFKGVRTLFSLNAAWQQAVKSRTVYDTRVRTHSTETLAVVINSRPPESSAVHSHLSHRQDFYTIALYSMRDNSWYELPPIPGIFSGIPIASRCVALEGKIYILGGEEADNFNWSARVYVLDLMGKRQWQQCANMAEGKQQFCASVMDGKIYVCGGLPGRGLYPNEVGGCEVYDPKVNAWCQIRPMTSMRYDHSVAAVGDQLFVHGGWVWNTVDWPEMDLGDRRGDLNENSIDEEQEIYDHRVAAVGDQLFVHAGWVWNTGDWPEMDLDDRRGDLNENNIDEEQEIHQLDAPLPLVEIPAEGVEVYHLLNDEWRVIRPFAKKELGAVFTAQGKLLVVTQLSIHVHDVEKHSWTVLQRCSFPGLGSITSILTPAAAVGVDDEVLLLAHWREHRNGSNLRKTGLFQSKGFGKENTKIVWEQVKCSRTCGDRCVMLGSPFDRFPPVMCTVEL